MRRPVLLSLSTLGLLICLIGGTGLFAALTDTADLGPNSVDAAGLPGSADLKLAYRVPDPGDPNATVCGQYEDDLTTQAFIEASGFVADSSANNKVCIKNAGSQTVSVSVTAVDLVDVDTACTGDEADLGDATCGGDAQGELANVIQIRIFPIDCATALELGGSDASALDDLVGTPLALTPSGLAPDAELCLDILVQEPSGSPALDRQLAQSDAVTWMFRFTGTAGS
jgi:hypothetical protein